MNGVGRIPLMIVSFLLSLGLWGYVRWQEASQTSSGSYTLPIEVRGLPEGYRVMSKPDSYQFYPIGTDEEIRRIRKEDLHAYVDLSRPKVGGNMYPVLLETTREYSVTWDPKMPQVRITVDEIVQNVEKAVRVRARGQVADRNYDYVPEQTVTNPPNVYVTGPKSIVDSIAYAEATIDLTTIRAGETRSKQSPVQLISKEGTLVDASNITVSPAETIMVTPGLRAAPEERMLLVSPLFQGSVPFGLRISRADAVPTQVLVRGTPEALNAAGVLETEPINLSRLRESGTLKVKLRLPAGLTVPGSTEVEVRFVITKAPGSQNPAKTSKLP